jgi:hypothetical protein
MIDHDDLLATMYDDDAVVVPPVAAPVGTRKIRVGIVEYEVPTVEYVRQLEQLLAQQTQMINQHRRAIQRLDMLLHGTRKFVRRYGDTISDIQLDMIRKVDHS